MKALSGFAVLAAILGVWTWRQAPVFEIARNEGPVHAVAFANSGSLLVTRTHDFISVYSLPSGERVAHRPAWLGPGRFWASTLVTPDGRLLSDDTIFSLPGLSPQGTLPGSAVALSPRGDQVALLATQSLVLAPMRPGTPTQTLDGVNWRPGDAAFAPDGTSFACRFGGLPDFAIRIVVVGGAERASFSGRDVSALAFSPKGDTIVAVSPLDGFATFSAATGKELRRIRVRCDAGMGRPHVMRADFDFARDRLAWGNCSGSLEVRSLATGERLWSRAHAHRNGIDAIALSPDGRWLASGASDCVVRVWRID